MAKQFTNNTKLTRSDKAYLKFMDKPVVVKERGGKRAEFYRKNS